MNDAENLVLKKIK